MKDKTEVKDINEAQKRIKEVLKREKIVRYPADIKPSVKKGNKT